MKIDKLLNILLFPESLYKKISDKKLTLYLGIIFIGIVDFGFVIADNFKQFYRGDDQSKIIYNISLTIIFTLLLGIIDTLFFSIPLSDLFKRFKKNEKSKLTDETGNFVKLIKVYMVTHILILPAEIATFIMYKNVVNDVNSWLLYVAFFIDLIIPFWFSAAIARGINAIYDFKPIYKKLVFLATFVWNYLLGYAFSYIIFNWILKLFKV